MVERLQKIKLNLDTPRPLAIAGRPSITLPEAFHEISPAQPEVHQAKAAHLHKRHFMALFSFAVIVLMPLAGAGYYLHKVALDQYSSSVGFSVRKEETSSAIELLGGITELSGSSSSDADILVDFISSPHLVRSIDESVDLRAAWTRPRDPFFSLNTPTSIEGLTAHWTRMVSVEYDPSNGLIALRARAFDPATATLITQAIFDQSTAMINSLSAAAREDATRYARAELSRASNDLASARTALTDFRLRTQIVDPMADVAGRMGLVSSLQGQLAEALIDLDMIQSANRPNATRLAQAHRRVNVVQGLIDGERSALTNGQSAGTGQSYARIVAEFERFTTDLHFAEQSYLSARATLDIALSEAQRTSRYLAAHVPPTLAETAEYPRKITILALTSVAAILGWAILILGYYSVRDRR